MRTALKVIGGLFLFLLVGGFVFWLVANEDLPAGQPGPAAEALTDRMLTAVNAAAWDTTRYVTWDFAGRNQYLWDKERHYVRVTMGDDVVLLDTKSVTGKAYTDGQEVSGDAADELVQAAWANFCNDSFWLAAPFKARDPGTERSIATTEAGREGLLVRYTSGGVTPGDAYLWLLDERGLPEAWQMWTQILPVGGVESGWTDYTTLPTGAKLATLHPSPVFDLKLSGVRGGTQLVDVGETTDPFANL